jgi:nitrogen fixation protein FixH
MNPEQPRTATPSRRGLAWPIGIAVGLGAVVIANAIMITIALSNPSAPAAKDHWAESLRWEQELEQRQRSAALGWSIASLAWREPGHERIELRLIDRDGAPLVGLRGTLTLQRSDTAAYDVELDLVELGEGRYLADGEPNTSGLVRLTLTVERDTQRYVSQQQIELGALPVISELPGTGTLEAS